MSATQSGLYFLPKQQRPVVGRDVDGNFQLTIPMLDVLSAKRKEGYRVRWTGPEAEAFWNAHREDLKPGAAVYGEITHIFIHMGTGHNGKPELHARAISLTYCPPKNATTPTPRPLATA